MKLNWNFLGGVRGVQNKKPSVGGVWIFSGTANVKRSANVKKLHKVVNIETMLHFSYQYCNSTVMPLR